MSSITLLGPQRLQPILRRVVADLGVEGSIATVTAGWQEREAEDDELAEHLSGRTVNLALYARAAKLSKDDGELAAGLRDRQATLKRMQQLYRLRLDHQMAAVRELMERAEDSSLGEAELEAAFGAVRQLDQRHLERVEAVHREFEREFEPWKRPALSRQRGELGEILAGCDAIAIAGGHVAVLLNRLRLFGLDELIVGLPILAWSAGAMALAERVVLFHDSPPQGFGNAEVLENGLGLYGRIQPLPHARRRLKLSSRPRVAELARRFLPYVCVPMDDGDYLRVEGAALWAEAPLRRLSPGGDVHELEVGAV